MGDTFCHGCDWADSGYTHRHDDALDGSRIGCCAHTHTLEAGAARGAALATRAVYVIHEGGDTPVYTLCADCVAATVDPVATMGDMVGRVDDLHCIGCDYHVDPTCGPGHWCKPSASLADLSAAAAWRLRPDMTDEELQAEDDWIASLHA